MPCLILLLKYVTLLFMRLIPINCIDASDVIDVSGFKFSPKPQIDFSESGSFGFLTGVAIAKNISVTITRKSDDNKAIANALKEDYSANSNCHGRPLDALSAKTDYSVSVESKDTDSSVTVCVKSFVSCTSDSIDSTAFVLGVKTNYPVSVISAQQKVIR